MKKIILKTWLNTGIFCILLIIASFAIYNITHEILTHIHVEQRLAETIGRLLASLGLVMFYSKYFNKEDFGLRKKYFFKGLWIGGFMFLATANNLASAILTVSGLPSIKPSFYLMIIVIVEQIFVGVFEEFLVRGVILNILSEKIQNNQFKSRLAAISFSSVLFGLIHLLNLFSEPQMINATINQVFYATFIGIFLGAVYLRSKNIWVVVFFHAIYDIASEFPVIFHKIPAGAITDDSVTEVILNVALASVFAFVGLFIARKQDT